jgi:hypothetical protein
MATEVSKDCEGGIQTGYGLDLHGLACRRSSWADFANGHQEYGGPGTLYRNRLLGNAPNVADEPGGIHRARRGNGVAKEQRPFGKPINDPQRHR